MSRHNKGPNNGRGRPPHDDILTPAEWRTVEAVRHGLTNPQIARAHDVSLDAVKYHVANALDKLEFSSRRELAKWNGINKNSNLNKTEKNMTEVSLSGKIGQVARHVSNVKISTNWYRDILGLPHLFQFGNLSFFDCDGTRLFLSEGDGNPEHNSVIYFKVDDIRVMHEGLKAKGVEFTHAPHKIHVHDDGTEEWMAFFNDPDGQPIGLMGSY